MTLEINVGMCLYCRIMSCMYFSLFFPLAISGHCISNTYKRCWRVERRRHIQEFLEHRGKFLAFASASENPDVEQKTWKWQHLLTKEEPQRSLLSPAQGPGKKEAAQQDSSATFRSNYSSPAGHKTLDSTVTTISIFHPSMVWCQGDPGCLTTAQMMHTPLLLSAEVY